MTLEQLRIFVAVAAREHVTRGARDLNLTQSATSAAIRALEARHAVRLFDRVGRRVALTEAGRLFLAEAQSVLARAAGAEAVLADLSELKRGRLRLAASQTVANYWLPARLTAFGARFPGVAVELSIGNTGEAAALVREGAADLGVVEGVVDDPLLAAAAVAADEMVLVVAPGHEWARGAAVDLKGARWVLRETGSGTRAAFERAAAAAGLTAAGMDVALELPSNEAVQAAVEAGAGAAIVSRLVVERSIRLGSLFRVPFALPARQFFTLVHRQRYATRAALEFAGLLAAAAGHSKT